MSLFATIGSLYDVATNTRTAVDAARVELAADHGPLAALRAFAAMSENAVDDAAVDELAAAVDRVIQAGLWTARTAAAVADWLTNDRARIVAGLDGAIGVATDVAAWLARHRGAIVAGVDATIAGIGDAGYHARGWAARLDTWRST